MSPVILSPSTRRLAREIAAAWKRVMIINPTQVLYTFTFDPVTAKFAAHKR